jgi:hypothetical protein
MTVTVTGGATQDDMGTGTDAGDSLSVATAIAAGSGTGYIDSTDINDYYKVYVNSGQTISVDMTPPTGSDFDLYLYDSSQYQVDSSAYGGSQTDSVSDTATVDGYYYIYVEHWSGSGIYSMVITVTGGAAQDDANSGGDAGGSFAQALSIAAGSYTGYVDSTDVSDYYKVSLVSGQTIDVDLMPPTGSDFDLYLYDSSQSQVDSSIHGGSQTDSVSDTATTSGYYYICVEHWSGSGVYSFDVFLSAVDAQNDWSSGTDAGNSLDQALAISAGSGSGYVDSTDAYDYYKINVTAGAEISADLMPPAGADFDLYLYDTARSQVDSSIHSGSTTDSVSHIATSSGYHFVRVSRYSGSGTYSLTVSVSTTGALAESPHPYPNNYDHTWTITEPGAGKIRVHFSQLDTESGWDYVYIYDENNNLEESYTGSYRDIWTSWVAGSTIKIRLVSDGSITAYGFTVDDKQIGEASPPTPTDKYAILVGVNDYSDPFINDLVGCVEDAMDWRTYLVGEGYQISYFLADSQATEANVKAAIADVVSRANSNSTIVFAFSGHGAKSNEVGMSAGNSVVCCHDSGWGTNGNLTDLELQTAFSGYQGRLLVFLDSCRSGGMDEVATGSNRYMTTTCTDSGYGFGIPWYQNGAWGYWFVDRGLIQGESLHEDMEGNFTWARNQYISDILVGTEYNTPEHYPMEFDGDLTSLFTL